VTTRQRNSIAIGVVFVVTAAVYYFAAPFLGYRVEWAGSTMLVALGIALGIMAYVLTSGSSD
jgi:hypothetical protein